MSGFQLDTSGVVGIPGPMSRKLYSWIDLDAFTQGYIEALLSDIQWPDPAEGYGPSSSVVRFADLAPEALARIIEDCAAGQHAWRGIQDRRACGQKFWEGRQDGAFASFPVLTVTLGDDGKVYAAPAQGPSQ